MKVIKLLLISVVTFSACLNSNEQKRLNDNTRIVQQNDQFVPVVEKNCINLKDIKGVLSLNDNYSKPNDTIFLKNNNGSIWHKFSFYYDDSDGKYDFENEKFKPYSFHPDYFNLSLFVINMSESSYSVIVNHATGLIKELDIDNKALKFQTLEDHLIESTYSVNFNKENNPIRNKKNGEIIPIEKSNNYRISIRSISGNWMQIEYKDFNKENSTIGWIKWRDEHCLLIELFYFA